MNRSTINENSPCLSPVGIDESMPLSAQLGILLFQTGVKSNDSDQEHHAHHCKSADSRRAPHAL